MNPEQLKLVVATYASKLNNMIQTCDHYALNLEENKLAIIQLMESVPDKQYNILKNHITNYLKFVKNADQNKIVSPVNNLVSDIVQYAIYKIDNKLVEIPDNKLVEIPDNKLVEIPDNKLVEIENGEIVEIPDNKLVEIENGEIVRKHFVFSEHMRNYFQDKVNFFDSIIFKTTELNNTKLCITDYTFYNLQTPNMLEFRNYVKPFYVKCNMIDSFFLSYKNIIVSIHKKKINIRNKKNDNSVNIEFNCKSNFIFEDFKVKIIQNTLIVSKDNATLLLYIFNTNNLTFNILNDVEFNVYRHVKLIDNNKKLEIIFDEKFNKTIYYNTSFFIFQKKINIEGFIKTNVIIKRNKILLHVTEDEDIRVIKNDKIIESFVKQTNGDYYNETHNIIVNNIVEATLFINELYYGLNN